MVGARQELGMDRIDNSVGDGAGQGSKITIFNMTQWTGNYTSVGVTTITMDLNNFSSNTPLTIRLGLSGDGGLFSTNSEITLGANSGWTTAVFSVAAGDLTAVSGNSRTTGFDAALTLESVSELRIINSEDPSWNGPSLAATLGIDNITAVPVPAAFWLFGSGLLGLIGIARRKKAA